MSSTLLHLFTMAPQLNKTERRRALWEGRQFAKALASPSPKPRVEYSIQQRAFAHRSRDHMGIAAFMGGASFDGILSLHKAMREGTDSRLEYPLPYIARTLRALDWNERREAWRLFGQGLVL